MENLTLGQISATILFITAFIGGVIYLLNLLNKVAKKWVNSLLKPIDEKLDKLDNKIDDVDLANNKNFLVTCINDIEKNNELSETEKERFWESYEHYISIGGNSYIKEKVEELHSKGMI